ncbi:hypothetical protein HELRODRAFT_177763 [Helobdella robusta]|uniref:Uncharacterized protein n=1 Tax=Helobdella robusta TaxID=6412 RepID=T1FC76_HELRO|nr:hypothetical protein HELRODRAFT_177763 [Helobdella robusta]ESN97704.1 hypothetical protein HELRODRAFT_177763 [Helobdella robusta]
MTNSRTMFSNNIFGKIGTCQCGHKIKFKDQVNIKQCTSSSSVYALLTDVSSDLDVHDKPTKYNYCINDKMESKKPYCRSGVCLLGWIGTLCDKRDCYTNKGGCGEIMKCVQEIVNNEMIEKCFCEDVVGLAFIALTLSLVKFVTKLEPEKLKAYNQQFHQIQILIKSMSLNKLTFTAVEVTGFKCH